jgi:hypothetical protein
MIVEHTAYLYVLEEAIPDYSDEAPTSICPKCPRLVPILVDRINSQSNKPSKCAYLEDVMPRLASPTRCVTWCDLEDTLTGGSLDRLTGAVGQPVMALLSEDCWEIWHGGSPG